MNAIQWMPGVPIEGVTVDEGTVCWSSAKTYYYVTRGGLRPSFWLGERVEGPAPEEKKTDGMFSPGVAQFQRGADVYHRELLDFATFKVRTKHPMEKEPADLGSELFKDYASASRWSEADCAAPPTIAVWHIGERDALVLKPGDWLITREDGTKFRMSDADYQAARSR